MESGDISVVYKRKDVTVMVKSGCKVTVSLRPFGGGEASFVVEWSQGESLVEIIAGVVCVRASLSECVGIVGKFGVGG